MTRKHLLAAAALAAGVISSASAEPIACTVDCARGQTIGAALARGDARKPLTVLVRGTCNEYVHVTRDDVTLVGIPPGGAVRGPGNEAPAIHIQADRVFLQDLDVSGGGTAVVVGGPFLASMTKVVAHHPASGAAALVMLGSRAIFTAPVTTASGNGWEDLACGDSETSVDGVDGFSVDGGDFFEGSVSAGCTGFDD